MPLSVSSRFLLLSKTSANRTRPIPIAPSPAVIPIIAGEPRSLKLPADDFLFPNAFPVFVVALSEIVGVSDGVTDGVTVTVTEIDLVSLPVSDIVLENEIDFVTDLVTLMEAVTEMVPVILTLREAEVVFSGSAGVST